MRKLVSEWYRLPSGSVTPQFYCLDHSQQLVQGVTDTLLELIGDSLHPSELKLEALVEKAEAGLYTPADPDLPDWSVNNKDLWLVPPMAHPGRIAISNEYSGDFAVSEGAEPQQFTFAQFRAALKHWREFLALVARDGKEHWVGRRYETEFPE